MQQKLETTEGELDRRKVLQSMGMVGIGMTSVRSSEDHSSQNQSVTRSRCPQDRSPPPVVVQASRSTFSTRARLSVVSSYSEPTSPWMTFHANDLIDEKTLRTDTSGNSGEMR